MQNAEQQQDLVSRQDELCRAADELNRAEQEMAVLKSEHAHQLGQATKAVDEATAGHTGNEALKGQLESLQSEYQQACSLSFYLLSAILWGQNPFHDCTACTQIQRVWPPLRYHANGAISCLSDMRPESF